MLERQLALVERAIRATQRHRAAGRKPALVAIAGGQGLQAGRAVGGGDDGRHVAKHGPGVGARIAAVGEMGIAGEARRGHGAGHGHVHIETAGERVAMQIDDARQEREVDPPGHLAGERCVRREVERERLQAEDERRRRLTIDRHVA